MLSPLLKKLNLSNQRTIHVPNASESFDGELSSLTIKPITDLQPGAIEHLVAESLAEGFRFLQRLAQEYDDGTNCFDKLGEALLAASSQGKIIGIGGLNRDPYLNDPAIGRLRHLYVASAWRGQGVGRLLVTQLVEVAKPYYRVLTLRTDTVAAAQFYQCLGFSMKWGCFWDSDAPRLAVPPGAVLTISSPFTGAARSA